jgi:hypothetical protein
VKPKHPAAVPLRLTATLLVAGLAARADGVVPTSATRPSLHRYLIARTFPAGALDGLDATAKAMVNARNGSVGVRWVRSYATADLTHTWCLYEAPSKAAVSRAAALNDLPIDAITEVPVELLPGPQPPMQVPGRRFLIERNFPAGALDGLDDAAKARVNANNAGVGVRWVRSYATADRTKTFCIYEGPNAEAVRRAALHNALPADRITEVPVELLPE